MNKKLYQSIQASQENHKKLLCLLIDPDKFGEEQKTRLEQVVLHSLVDLIFVGGSLIQGSNMQETTRAIKSISSLPLVIFPGNHMHLDRQADAILFLSLISGRNPDFLIGQHVIAAPFLKKTNLEILPTGYILIDGGRSTTVSYISNTTPIPRDKPEVAACTAMAGEMLGLKLMYADAGSGAQLSIPPALIRALRKSVDIPLIIGGGIRSAQQAQEAYKAGADMLVIGNAAETSSQIIPDIRQMMHDQGWVQA